MTGSEEELTEVADLVSPVLTIRMWLSYLYNSFAKEPLEPEETTQKLSKATF
jgi:hypothetical protein